MLNTIAGLEGCFHFGMAQSLSVIIECNWCTADVAALSRSMKGSAGLADLKQDTHGLF